MPRVEIENIRGLAVQDQSDWERVLEDLPRDVIPTTEFVTESVAVSIKQKTTLATKSYMLTSAC
jgi:hypothetical protein